MKTAFFLSMKESKMSVTLTVCQFAGDVVGAENTKAMKTTKKVRVIIGEVRARRESLNSARAVAARVAARVAFVKRLRAAFEKQFDLMDEGAAQFGTEFVAHAACSVLMEVSGERSGE
jgi:hypothetical protein